jgi:ActR/RegA family two-component response regulator
MKDAMPRTLIIVDDDALMTLELSHALTEFGFAVLGQARNLTDARKLLRVRLPAAALVGAQLANGEDGVTLSRDLQACDVRVVLTGRNSVDSWTGPFLRKPFETQSAIDLLAVQQEPTVAKTWVRGVSFD